MSIFVLATPEALEAPTESLRVAEDLWRGLQHTWTSWDGTVFELSRPSSGVFFTPDGLRGMGPPTLRAYTSESPVVAGQSFRGSVATAREVFWPLCVYSDTDSDTWMALDQALWQSFLPDKTGVWTVAVPGKEPRSLTLRFSDDGGASYTYDPFRKGWAKYGITLVADQPMWEGPEVNQTWTAVTPLPFFPGPPFFITEGGTETKISNPGEVDAYPTWFLQGPLNPGTSFGVGNQTISVPFSLSSGETLRIDSHPSAQTVIDHNGFSRFGSLGSPKFASIPAGESVQLSISVTGDGSITMSFRPRYYRAW